MASNTDMPCRTSSIGTGNVAGGHAAHIAHPAREFDHMIERMHADGRQRAARRFLGRGSPIVRRDELTGAGGVLRHHGDDGAEPSLGETPSHLHHGRMEAPAVADRQHHARLARGLDRPIGAGAVERDGLLDVDVLACRGGRDDLRFMQAVWRGEDDRVYIPIREEFLVAVDQRQLLAAAESFSRRARAGVGEHEAQVFALALHRCDQRAPPASQSYDRGTDHLIIVRASRGWDRYHRPWLDRPLSRARTRRLTSGPIPPTPLPGKIMYTNPAIIGAAQSSYTPPPPPL